VKISVKIIDLSASVFPLYTFERNENIQHFNGSRIVAFNLIYFVKPPRPDALDEKMERNNDGVLCPLSRKKVRVFEVLILKPEGN
jgi:hypothetical protein